jgi:transposase, IS5 family
MRTLTDFAIHQIYEQLKELGDKLVDTGDLINWEAFRPMLEDLYDNKSERGGRPNIDVIIMLKALFIQQLYSLSDEQLERELTDRISFRVFLCTTEIVPDSTTIWLFRERLAESGTDKDVWDELQRQLDAMNLTVKKGIMQDASFITSDPGHARKDTPRGGEAKTRRSRDGTWAKKGTKSYFGYKMHSAMDENHGLIRRIEVTPANVHDSQVDLANEGEVRYADKGYVGAKTKGYDATMRKATRGHQLSYKDEMRNRRISRIRSPVERIFAFTKCVCKAGHVMVTTVARVRVKMMITGIVFNLFHLNSAKGKASA